MSDHHDRLLALLSYDQCFLTKDDANEVAAWIRSLSAENSEWREIGHYILSMLEALDNYDND
jgi:hypothetical protein